MNVKQLLYVFLEKMTGRYWMAFVICAGLFYVGKLSSEDFKWIVMAFIGGGVGSKAADAVKAPTISASISSGPADFLAGRP